jgi:hypothetical protein
MEISCPVLKQMMRKLNLSEVKIVVLAEIFLKAANGKITKAFIHSPIEDLAASIISLALSSSPTISVNSGSASSVSFDLSFTNLAVFAYR